jgi:hypothetical protein
MKKRQSRMEQIRRRKQQVNLGQGWCEGLSQKRGKAAREVDLSESVLMTVNWMTMIWIDGLCFMTAGWSETSPSNQHHADTEVA